MCDGPKQQKSEFASGLGAALFEFVKAISDEVRKSGGSDDDLRKVIAQADLPSHRRDHHGRGK